jgi:hypothetical protein
MKLSRQHTYSLVMFLIGIVIASVVLAWTRKSKSAIPMPRNNNFGLPIVVEHLLESAQLIRGSLPPEGQTTNWTLTEGTAEHIVSIANLGAMSSTSGYHWIRVGIDKGLAEEKVDYRLTPIGRADIGSSIGWLVSHGGDIPIPVGYGGHFLEKGETLSLRPLYSFPDNDRTTSIKVSIIAISLVEGTKETFLELRTRRNVEGEGIEVIWENARLRKHGIKPTDGLGTNEAFVLKRGQGLAVLKCSMCHQSYRQSDLCFRSPEELNGKVFSLSEDLHHWKQNTLAEQWLILTAKPGNQLDHKPRLTVERLDSLGAPQVGIPAWMKIGKVEDLFKTGQISVENMGPPTSYVEDLLGQIPQIQVKKVGGTLLAEQAGGEQGTHSSRKENSPSNHNAP